MNAINVVLIFVVLLATTAGNAQQSPSPQPPQTKSAVPCTTLPKTPQDPRLQAKPKSKWRQPYDQKMAEIQKETGIDPPDIAGDVAGKVNQTLHPCPVPTTVQPPIPTTK